MQHIFKLEPIRIPGNSFDYARLNSKYMMRRTLEGDKGRGVHTKEAAADALGRKDPNEVVGACLFRHGLLDLLSATVHKQHGNTHTNKIERPTAVPTLTINK